MERVRAVAKDAARQLNRLRWLRKARIAAAADGRADTATRMRYVLWDPELDTFSYDVANADGLATGLAPVLGITPAVVHSYFNELLTDARLAGWVRRAARWDAAVKHHPGLGRHLVPYACLRARRPPVALEVGVRYGLGTLALLRALERNLAEDGGPAPALVSVDIDPFAGRLARRTAASGDLHVGWEFHAGASPEALYGALGDRQIGFLLSDSVPIAEVTRGELAFAAQHASAPLVVVQSDWNEELPRACATAGTACVRLRDEPVTHVVGGKGCFVAAVADPRALLATLSTPPPA